MKYYIAELYSDKWGYGQERVFETEKEAVEWLGKEWDFLTKKEKALQDLAHVYEIEFDGDLEEYREYNVLQDLWVRDVVDMNKDEEPKMKKYLIQDREAGNVIEECDTLEEAEKVLADYEAEDEKDGTYTPDFYEIVEA